MYGGRYGYSGGKKENTNWLTSDRNGEQAFLSSGNMRRIEFVNLQLLTFAERERWKSGCRITMQFREWHWITHSEWIENERRASNKFAVNIGNLERKMTIIFRHCLNHWCQYEQHLEFHQMKPSKAIFHPQIVAHIHGKMLVGLVSICFMFIHTLCVCCMLGYCSLYSVHSLSLHSNCSAQAKPIDYNSFIGVTKQGVF